MTASISEKIKMREVICEIIKALPFPVILLAMPVVVPLVILRGIWRMIRRGLGLCRANPSWLVTLALVPWAILRSFGRMVWRNRIAGQWTCADTVWFVVMFLVLILGGWIKCDRAPGEVLHLVWVTWLEGQGFIDLPETFNRDLCP